jgi:O-antigen/teichoic acid export membrane protein
MEELPYAIEDAAGALSGVASVTTKRHYALTLLAVTAISFPTVGDVVLVRHSYSAKQAGLYAAVALVGRCVLFLAVAVNSVVYPKMVAAPTLTAKLHLRNKALAASAGLCGVAAAALVAMPHLTLLALAGSSYTQDQGLLRTYVLGCLAFALAATFVYYLLAAGRAKPLVVLLAPALAAQVALPLVIAHNVRALVLATMALAGCFLVASVATAARVALSTGHARSAGQVRPSVYPAQVLGTAARGDGGAS